MNRDKDRRQSSHNNKRSHSSPEDERYSRQRKEHSLRELREKAAEEASYHHKHRNKDDENHKNRKRSRDRSPSLDDGDRRHSSVRDRNRKYENDSRRFLSPSNYRNPSRSPGSIHSEKKNSKPFKRPFGDSKHHHRERSDDERTLLNSKKNEKESPPPPEIKPNFELTGALARDTNTFNGIVVKYNQPPEAKKPSKHWRLYPFKGDQALDFISIHNQSAYLLGRERKVADIPIDHPSCSKQHAVIQFRCVPFERKDGTTGKVTRPYIIDLESANGTFVNGKRIEPRRYVELMERDVLKFAFSSRDYVLLHEHSAKDDDDEDVQQSPSQDKQL